MRGVKWAVGEERIGDEGRKNGQWEKKEWTMRGAKWEIRGEKMVDEGRKNEAMWEQNGVDEGRKNGKKALKMGGGERKKGQKNVIKMDSERMKKINFFKNSKITKKRARKMALERKIFVSLG